MQIQCSNCGRIKGFRFSKKQTTQLVQDGWNSFGNALYCPACSSAWAERNCRDCWGALPLASAAGLATIDRKLQDPCKNCRLACPGKDACYKKQTFDDIVQDIEAER